MSQLKDMVARNVHTCKVGEARLEMSEDMRQDLDEIVDNIQRYSQKSLLQTLNRLGYTRVTLWSVRAHVAGECSCRR